jgi:hypothetical protein
VFHKILAAIFPNAFGCIVNFVIFASALGKRVLVRGAAVLLATVFFPEQKVFFTKH